MHIKFLAHPGYPRVYEGAGGAKSVLPL